MFKRNKKSAAELQEQLKELSGSQKFEKDPAEWTLTTDKAGNGSATIRFLPARDVDGEVVPFQKIYSHSFKDAATGKWYIENCPTTIGRGYDDCPVCRANSALYEAGQKGDKLAEAKAIQRSRKLSYWANIVVIKDDANPDANGKVFKYRFGKKIFDKIIAATAPELEDESPINVTDVFEGANFLLKVKKVGDFPNYDDSKFSSKTSALFDGDEEKLKAAWDSMHSLKEIVADKHFKSTEDLEKSYARATGANASRKETAIEREVREARTEAPTRVIETPAVDDGGDDIFGNDTATGTDASNSEIDDIEGFLRSLS